MPFDASYICGSKDNENEAFRAFLKGFHGEEIDDLVFPIQESVTARTDCTQCGNCCRSLMINVEQHELKPIANSLKMSVETVKQKFIEESAGGQMVINTIPCHFLEENKCTVYNDRFHECREFPHLHKKGFTRRLFGTFMHYDRCPIIQQTIELLKKELNFDYESTPFYQQSS